MGIISNIYLLIFLPLIASLCCQIFSKRKTAFLIAIITALFSLVLSLKIAPEVFAHDKIANDFKLSSLSIAFEFKLDVLSIIFLPLVILLKILILLFYRLDIESTLDKKFHNIFYAIFLINLFALIGIFTTDNILNLFLFCEIYAFSFFASASISKDEDLLKLTFGYFCLNAISSLLILFCFLALYLSFGSLDFASLAADIALLGKSNISYLAAIFLTLTLSFIIKFFPFWIYFKKLKNINLIANFLSTESLFIKANIGIFLAIKFIYLLFGTSLVYSNMWLKLIFLTLAITIIIYSLIKIYAQRHLKVMAAYLCLNNLGFMFACLALHNITSLQALFFYMINFNLLNLFLFIFGSFLKRYFATSAIDKICLVRKHHPSLLLPLRLSLIFIAAFPFTILFYAHWHLFYSILALDVELLLSFFLLISNFVYIRAATRVFSASFRSVKKTDEAELKLPGKSQHFAYMSFFFFLISCIYVTLFMSGFFNDVSLKFASYLLLNTI